MTGTRTIGEITSHIGSGSTPRGGRAVYLSNGIPFIRSQNVRDGRLDLSDVACIAPEVHASMKRSVVQPSDVLLNITGASIGRSCVVPANVASANVSQHVCILRSNGEVLPGYLHAMLELAQTQHRIGELAAGGSREGLNFQQVAALAIPWVPLEQQCVFVRLRDKCASASYCLRELVLAKRTLKRGLMRDLLVGRRRFPEFSAAGAWRYARLGDIAEGLTRRNTGGAVEQVLTCSGEHGLISQGDFFSKLVASESREDYFLLLRGEFAYNRSAMAGYPFGAIKRLDRYDAGVLSTLNICFRLTEDEWESDFAAHYFESGLLNEQLGRITRVGSRAHGLLNVTKADFFDLKVPVPPREEQVRIASLFNTLDREMLLLEREQALRETQKHGLLHRLMSGNLSMPDAEWSDAVPIYA